MLDTQQMTQLGDSIETAEIDDLAVTFAKLSTACQRQLVPVGTILLWAKSITGVPSIPTGWIECDGSAVSDADSPINGQNVPNLTNKMIRGAATSGGTGGSDTHSHGLTSKGNAPDAQGDCAAEGSTDSASTLPAYYEVVFIIKIK